jgi:hypothetical protein
MDDATDVGARPRSSVLASRGEHIRISGSDEQPKSAIRRGIRSSYGYSGRVWNRRFETTKTRKQILFWVWDRLTIILWSGLCCVALIAIFLVR